MSTTVPCEVANGCLLIPIPDRGIDSVDVNYTGAGTSATDVIVALGVPIGIGLSVVLMMVVYWYFNSKRRA